MRRLLFAAAIWAGAMGGAAAQITTAPPEGFEALEEPQTAPVDVFFGLKRIGEVTATFAPGWVELSDPAAAVALVADVRPEKIGEVTAALQGRLNPHTDRSCAPERFPGCGTLDDVPVAAAIFNPDYFRLDLAFSPSVLLEQAMSGRYLDDPVTGPSFLANLRAGGSGSTGGDQILSAGIDSWLSRGRNALRFDATAQTDNEVTVVDRLSAERFGRDHHYMGGLIDDFGTRFSRVPALLGARVETYLDTRLDLAASAGTPVVVFLPERSQVDILVDGRLVAAQAYDAGNQRIDTSRLPQGAYELTLRIRGSSGSVREERISFVKDQSFPPAGEWQYFAETGVIANDQESGLFPKVLSTPIVKGGVSRRLLDEVAGRVTLSATDTDLLGEVDLRYILTDLTGGVQFAGTTGGGVGFGANAYWHKGRFSLGFGGDIVLGPGSQDEEDDEDWRHFNGLDAARRSVSGSFGYSWSDGTQFRFVSYYRDEDGTSWGAGPQVSRPLYRTRTFSADLDLEATAGDSETLALARVTFRWSPVGTPSRVYGSLGARWREADSGDQGFGSTGLLGATYEFEDVLGGPTTLGAEVARDEDGTNRLTFDADSETAWGSLNAATDIEAGGGSGNQVLYRGFARTTVAANGDGVAVGGLSPGDAAILAKFQGDADVGSVAVTSGSGTPVTVRAGSTAVIPVAPFHYYEPYARAADQQIVDLQHQAQTLPIYPGNVATATWKVRRLFSIYGRVVTPAGAPVANARIQDVEDFAFTDEDGNFVVEVEEEGPHRVEPMDGGAACTIDLLATKPPKGEDVIGAGDVVCLPGS